ncbi:ATP-binding cassette domain-containing protein [Jiella sonneratiae]|uniref:ATP-binding cassette domain-containing protein n=1 Tax=Jiella sonneratiae TaxID=2816856 RepID=A0ABS3IXV4_9HYPH|nr:ATP-binding cassette domain-containing protein [Jiella sonneratiae]MBO0902221.1 ATP-binding cassette domain-containing protein [Jiella sonneratiae]
MSTIVDTARDAGDARRDTVMRDDPPRRGSAGLWRLALALAALSLTAAILLTSVSVWFLGAVALAGAGSAAIGFDFHTPGALVRLFALTRTAAKYGERLSGHAAALTDQVALRLTIFEAMAAAPSTTSAGWQLSREERLADWLDDVEDRDDERLRVVFPAATLSLGLVLLAIATAVVAAAAAPAILLLAAAGLLLMRHSMRRIGAAETAARAARRKGSAGLGAALQALVPLAAEGLRRSETAAALDHFRNVQSLQRDQAEALAAIDVAAGLFGPLAVTAVMLAAWQAGARGDALLPAAFVGFGWLALGEAAGVVSKIVLGRVKAVRARAGLAVWTDPDERRAAVSPVLAGRVTAVSLVGLGLQAPGGRAFCRRLDATFLVGRPTALVGVSGSGKTTLLKTIAGWLAPAGGTIHVDGEAANPAARQGLVHLCLHDAAILSDTVRANLFAGGASDAEIAAALAFVELGERVAAGGGLDAWVTQDRLSLGEAQRLNLARAFLTTAPVILLDEPMEHLDPAQAVRILARLRRHAEDRVLVYSAHRPPLAGDAVLSL